MLDELSEEQRSATVMYYFDEISVKDIAEIQGVSEGTVKSRLNYARKSMRALVEDYENKNGIKLHTENDFSIFKWLLQPVSDKDLAERRAKVLSESLTNATGVEFSIALEENSSEPTEKAAAPAPKKKMFGDISTTTVVVSLAAAVILIAILFFGFVLKMFDNFFDRFNAFGRFGGGASSSSSINPSSVDDPSTIVSNNDSEVSSTEEPDVSSDAPVSSSEPTPSSTPTSSSQPTAKNECFGSDTSFRDNQVDIRPKHVYWENGYLCVEAYVINGCSVPVQNIAVRHLSVSTEEKGFIASGVFNNPGIPAIAPYYNRIHIFRFRPEDVIYANADLTDGVILTYQVGFDKIN
jgi:predicted DNA-binding protein YlxM (UPF0122 family)